MLTVGIAQIVAPVGLATGFPMIEWTQAEEAVDYEIHVNNLTTGVNRVVREDGIAGLNFIPAAEQPASDYRAWVRAHSDVESGPWSLPFDFSVESDVLPSPGAVPEISFNESGEQLVVQWDAAVWADSYEVEIRSTNSHIGRILRTSGIVETSLAISEQWPGGEYVASIRGHNASGSGPWSVPTSVSLDGASTPPPTPQLTIQSSFTKNERLAVLWSDQAGPAFLDLHINNIDDEPYRVLNISNQYGNQVVIDSGLEAGQYRIWGRLKNGLGSSEWSDPIDFEISLPVSLPALGQPTIVPFSATVYESRPLLKWSPDEGAFRYEVWVNVTTQDHDGPWFWKTNVRDHQLRIPTSLLPGHGYKFWVRGFNHDDIAGPWSDPIEFQVSDSIPMPSRPH